jgi:hypothetical protein
LNGEAHTLRSLSKNFKIQPVACCARNKNPVENHIFR